MEQWKSLVHVHCKKKSEKNPFFQKKDRFPAFKSPFELTTIGVKDTDMIKIYFYGA